MNVVSFGGGTNSTAMIIGMYLHKIPIDLILFADTGGEQPHTYEFMGTFNEWLVKHGIPKIVSVEYHDKDGNRLTLEQECINSGRLPSIAYGYKKCSLKHKIGTQEKFCNNYQPCKEVWASGQRVHKYIGYDAGETRRIQHAAPIDEADKKYEKHYPLYEWGWTREECVHVIERAGLPRPGKSSCFFCPSMKKKEIQALWENYPDLFERAIALEHGSAKTEVRNGKIAIKGKEYPIKLTDGFYIIRKLTVTECKRLQTVPDTYTFPVSDTQAYKMLGNGWTVDVIAHIMSHFDGLTEEPVEVLSMYDGMSCGHIALDKLGVDVTAYYATEIDKYAIQTTQHNFPDTVQLGDAFQVRDEEWRPRRAEEAE